MNLKAENKHKRTREAISTTREISNEKSDATGWREAAIVYV